MEECKHCGMNVDDGTNLCDKCKSDLPGVGFTSFKVEIDQSFFGIKDVDKLERELREHLQERWKNE